MATAPAREGVHVAVTGCNAEGLAQTVKMIESVGGKALALNWDLADLNAIDSHLQTIEGQLGPIDILINNTGEYRWATPNRCEWSRATIVAK